MPEPLTTQLVAEQVQKLLAAFPSRNVAGQNVVHTADVYRNGLRGLSGDSLRAAVDLSIQQDSYFPKVARLRELAQQWARYNQPQRQEQFVDTDPLWCAGCQSRAEWRDRWRPKVDRLHRRVLIDGNRYMLLEQYARLVCKCSPPCRYAPIDGLEPPMMLTEFAGKSHQPPETSHAAD